MSLIGFFLFVLILEVDYIIHSMFVIDLTFCEFIFTM